MRMLDMLRHSEATERSDTASPASPVPAQFLTAASTTHSPWVGWPNGPIRGGAAGLARARVHYLKFTHLGAAPGLLIGHQYSYRCTG